MSDFWDDKAQLDAFWGDSGYFTGQPLTDPMVTEAERRFGYKLPQAYLRLLRLRNGGSPTRSYFPIEGLRGWDAGYLVVESLRGIGPRGWLWGIDANHDNYPRIGLVIGDTPSGGHDYVMLDYSRCGPKGEPRVVHAEQGCAASEVTLLAPNFAAFVAALSDRPPAGDGD
jgi:hypothetical protein